MLSARRIAFLFTLLAGCALRPAPGHLEKLEPDTSFAKVPGTLWIQGPDGVSAVHLDGSGRRALFPAGLSVIDAVDDGSRTLLRDASGVLVVADASGLHPLPQGPSASVAALSSDGSDVAVLHRPHRGERAGTWVEDDAVDIVDLPSMQVRTLAAEHQVSIEGASFALDGTAIWLQLAGRGEVVPVDGGARHFEENPPFALRVPLPQRNRPDCASTGARLQTSDDGVELIAPNQPPRRILALQGHRRGLSDTLPAFDDAFFDPSCRAAIAVFDGNIVVVDLDSGRAGALAKGYAAYFGPEQASGQAQAR